VSDGGEAMARALAASLGAPLPKLVRHRPYWCPACNSGDIGAPEEAALASVAPHLREHQWDCRGCGLRWEAPLLVDWPP
jgi:hypothetical protein